MLDYKKTKIKEDREGKSGKKKPPEKSAEEENEANVGDKKPKGRETLGSGREAASVKAVGRSRSWKPSFKDPRKAGQLVSQVLDTKGDYLCLSCRAGFLSYKDLKRHAAASCPGKCSSIFRPSPKESLLNHRPRGQTDRKYTPELAGYVTGKQETKLFTVSRYHTFSVASKSVGNCVHQAILINK